eukprot:8081859-Pyramimonas_sp.AAC.1
MGYVWATTDLKTFKSQMNFEWLVTISYAPPCTALTRDALTPVIKLAAVCKRVCKKVSHIWSRFTTIRSVRLRETRRPRRTPKA